MSRNSWTFITNHGAVLAFIGQRPRVTAREIARELDITERTVLRIIKDLEQAGYLMRERVGRENRYEVHLNQPLRRQDQRSTMVGDVLKALQYPSET
jgi:DNA-binding Lrp family transcriptional regulator